MSCHTSHPFIDAVLVLTLGVPTLLVIAYWLVPVVDRTLDKVLDGLDPSAEGRGK